MVPEGKPEPVRLTDVTPGVPREGDVGELRVICVCADAAPAKAIVRIIATTIPSFDRRLYMLASPKKFSSSVRKPRHTTSVPPEGWLHLAPNFRFVFLTTADGAS